MATATLKQTIANRLNALRSTGPTSAEGKVRSSQNARTHGLSRIGTRPPADLAAAIAERNQQWFHDYRPSGPAQLWHFERLCAESVRLEFCEARILATRSERAQRADESWDDDRAAVIARDAKSLAQRPDVIQPCLLQSRHGVLWLLDRWDEVTDSLNRHEGWTRDTWDRALDLLGVSTLARDGSGPWDLDPDDSGNAPGDLVARSVAALRDRLTSHLNARDDRARADAALGLDPDDPPEIRLLERYAADARRRIAHAMNELRRLQSLASRSSTPAELPPGPRPDRSSNRAQPEPTTTSAPSQSNSPAGPPSPARNEPVDDIRSAAHFGASLIRNIPSTSSQPLNRRVCRALAAASRRSSRS